MHFYIGPNYIKSAVRTLFNNKQTLVVQLVADSNMDICAMKWPQNLFY